jgi:hypothetical protein
MTELQHAVFETVIGVAVAAPFTVGTGGENTFDIGDSFAPPLQGSTVVGAWYEPIDNVPDLKGFSNITVNAGQPTADDVSLHFKGLNNPAILRIRVHALFTR